MYEQHIINRVHNTIVETLIEILYSKENIPKIIEEIKSPQWNKLTKEERIQYVEDYRRKQAEKIFEENKKKYKNVTSWDNAKKYYRELKKLCMD